jgi:hypothetical protein
MKNSPAARTGGSHSAYPGRQGVASIYVGLTNAPSQVVNLAALLP